MRTLLLLLGLGTGVAITGCAEQPKALNPAAKPASSQQSAVAANSSYEMLKPLLMAQKPAKVITVTEAMQRKEGEVVIVTGRTPPEKVKPYNTAVAAFIILSHESLDREEVKDEFECDDAATCPSCRKLLDKLGVRVELVDQAGVIIPTSLEGFADLKPGSTITVEGTIKHDGKDKKLVRIVASKFYPG